MTDNDIIKAFECCICDECESCPHDEETACVENLHQEAIDLINRQKAEIKRLEDKLDTIKRELIETIPLIEEDIKTAKAEAVKEFAKFLVDKAENGVISIADLPDYVREKVGEG